MSALPLVSIVVPVYNGEKYLRESLDSILGQTYDRTEILVMDDASTDGTSEIIKSYGDKVKSYRQPSNVGQFQNVNDGIGMVSGEFVCVYHSDDIYLPDIVEKEVGFLIKHPEAGAVFCLDIFVDENNREYNRLKIPPEVQGGEPIPYKKVLNGILKYKNRFLRCPGAMVRASVYDDVGLYRWKEFHIASDLEMWLRISRKYPIGILEKHLFRYRHGHGNATQQFYHLRTEQEQHFRILDLYLAEGGDKIVTPESLAAHEAHRAEDMIMVAINSYIKGELHEAGKFLRRVEYKYLLGSLQVQRWRLLILFVALKILVRLPRIPVLAKAFYNRWHVKKYE